MADSDVSTVLAQLHQGVLVVHPRRPEWGPGKVLRVVGSRVTVYFRDIPGATVGEAIKTIDLTHAPLEVARDQSDEWLDNLKVGDGGRVNELRSRVAFPDAVKLFFSVFPQGFADTGYLKEERNYKRAAHEAFEESLGGGQLRNFLAAGEEGEAVKRALRVVSKVNLLSLFEASAMRDGLKEPVAAARFVRSLADLLEVGPEPVRFEALVSAVQGFPAEKGKSSPDKWTIVTILPFLARPDAFPFLKPEVTKNAASMLFLELMYEPSPNWRTYRRLLDLGERLRNRLASHGLPAADWIDLQSFIWVVGDKTYQARAAHQSGPGPS